jgi:hypothetical protein
MKRGEDLERGLFFLFLEEKLGDGEGERNYERRRTLGNKLFFGNSHRDIVVVGNVGLGG